MVTITYTMSALTSCVTDTVLQSTVYTYFHILDISLMIYAITFECAYRNFYLIHLKLSPILQENSIIQMSFPTFDIRIFFVIIQIIN